MNTVLTIDFDIILYQDLPLYNTIISGNKDDGIDNLSKEFPMIKNSRFDYFMYKDITNFILTLFSKLDKSQIYFCLDHHAVVNITEDLDNFNLINMDFHHDISYRLEDNQWYEKLTSKELGCANWVKYLRDKEKTNNYTWIQAPIHMLEFPPKEFLPEKTLIMPDDYDEIKNEILKADKLIICASFNWIPEQYHELFYLWVDLYRHFYNIKDTVIIY